MNTHTIVSDAITAALKGGLDKGNSECRELAASDRDFLFLYETEHNDFVVILNSNDVADSFSCFDDKNKAVEYFISQIKPSMLVDFGSFSLLKVNDFDFIDNVGSIFTVHNLDTIDFDLTEADVEGEFLLAHFEDRSTIKLEDVEECYYSDVFNFLAEDADVREDLENEIKNSEQ